MAVLWRKSDFVRESDFLSPEIGFFTSDNGFSAGDFYFGRPVVFSPGQRPPVFPGRPALSGTGRSDSQKILFSCGLKRLFSFYANYFYNTLILTIITVFIIIASIHTTETLFSATIIDMRLIRFLSPDSVDTSLESHRT
jgi:hypothetical protein